MADEHVLLPRERYQRLMNKTNENLESKKSDDDKATLKPTKKNGENAKKIVTRNAMELTNIKKKRKYEKPYQRSDARNMTLKPIKKIEEKIEKMTASDSKKIESGGVKRTAPKTEERPPGIPVISDWIRF